MITNLRNTQAHPPGVRAVGPHVHTWVEIGRDAQGEVYRECSFCGARSCVHRARFEAFRQDWLNYREDWAPVAAPSPEPDPEAGPEDDEPEPVKRKPGRPRKSA